MGKAYSQLSLDERCEIYRMHAYGKSPAEIGAEIGRDRTTIWRELKRNSGAQVEYKVEWAEPQTRARRQRRLYKLECSSTLRDLVLDRLAMGWSPEQIAGRLEQEHGRRVISHESIYRYVYWRVRQKDYLHRLLPRRKFQRGFQERLDEIALDYNLTHRKCLNFRTPAEVFLRTRLELCVALEM